MRRSLILVTGLGLGLALLLGLLLSDDQEQLTTPPPSEAHAGIRLPTGTLDAAAVTALFSNMTVESRTAVKQRVSRTYYDPGGAVLQRRGDATRRGLWRVRKDGRICLQMEDRAESCRIIVRGLGGGYRKYIVRKNGLHQPTVDYISFVAGDQISK